MLDSTSAARQHGAVLIVSLVMLLVVTLLGVSGMSNTSLELRMSASAAAVTELRQGAESVAALAIDQIEAERALGEDNEDWRTIERGSDAADLLPPQTPCAAAQWRVVSLEQSASGAARLSGADVESANFELQVECYELGDLNGDSVLDENDGPRARVVTGVTVTARSTLVSD